jgi:hypothetical protein
MQKFIILALILCLSQNLSHAKTKTDIKEKIKTIKFHKAQTEAERALDRVLMIDSGLIKNDKPGEEIFTKGFLADEARQQREYEKENNCSPEHDMCMFSETNHLTGSQDILTDIGLLYYTIYSDENVAYIYIMSRGWKTSVTGYNYGEEYIEETRNLKYNKNYAMKKEDGVWKIEGICSYTLKINHQHCFTYYSPYLDWAL